MTMLQGIEAWDDESFDDESFDDESFDDESYDDESEFLGTLLGGPAAAIGKAVGGLFGGGGRPSRPPLRPISVGTQGGGVSSATLNTPAGNATLRLPEPVVTRREFEAGIRKVQEGVNRDAARVNAVAKDLDTLRTRVGVVVTDTQRDIAKVRATVTKSQLANRRTLARLRREQDQQQMMSMVMTMMMQKQIQESIDDHKHAALNAVPVKGEDESNSMLMMLPMMMMSGGGGGGSDNAMMMPMMMLAMSK